MNTVKFSAALVVASSFVLGSSFAKANDLSAFEQNLQVAPVVQELDVTPVATSADQLSPSLLSAINDMSGSRQMPATKVSRYKLKVPINFGSIIDKSTGIPVLAQIGRGTDIVYVQQFDTPEQAKAAKRLCPVGLPIVCEKRSLPTNAKAALQLHANEMVSMMFNKSIVGGADLSTGFLTKGTAELKAGLLLKGEFEAQVSKLDATRVRLRIVISNGKGHEGDFEAKLPIQVFALAVSKLSGGLSIVPYAEIQRESLTGAMKVTDLVFNLADPTAAQAFDSVISGAISLKDFVNPVPFIATDLRPIYALAQADAGKPEAQRRVSLVSTMDASFHHSTKLNDFGIKAKALVVSIKLLHKQSETNENSISTKIIDQNGNESDANYASASQKTKNMQLLYGLIGSKEQRTGSTAVLSVLNDRGQATGEINFIVTQNLEDNRLRPSEQKEIALLLRHRMSAVFAQRMNLTSRFDAETIRNADIYTRVVFSQKALNSLSGRAAGSIAQAVQQYVGNDQSWLNYYSKDIAEMSQVLQRGLNARGPLSDRIAALNSLRDNRVFQQIGTGLMMWMMGAQDLESSVSVKLYMRGLGRADTNLQVGTLANPEALQAMQFLDDELNGYDDMVSSMDLNATLI